MKNPWGQTATGWIKQFTDTVETVTVDDRIRMVKEMNVEQLRAAIAWPGTQLTVKKRAESRLRALTRMKAWAETGEKILQEKGEK
jgi:hypothetical protein